MLRRSPHPHFFLLGATNLELDRIRETNWSGLSDSPLIEGVLVDLSPWLPSIVIRDREKSIPKKPKTKNRRLTNMNAL